MTALLPTSNHARAAALYNWNRPFNDQSVAHYRARHREDIELSRARGTHCPQIFATSATIASGNSIVPAKR
jgi:hypothetical protein